MQLRSIICIAGCLSILIGCSPTNQPILTEGGGSTFYVSTGDDQISIDRNETGFVMYTSDVPSSEFRTCYDFVPGNDLMRQEIENKIGQCRENCSVNGNSNIHFVFSESFTIRLSEPSYRYESDIVIVSSSPYYIYEDIQNFVHCPRVGFKYELYVLNDILDD